MSKARQILSRLAGRIGTLMLALLACSVLVGCGSGGSTPTGSPTGEDPTETKPFTIATQLSYAPYEYVEDGEVVGFEVDLANEVLKRMGYSTTWKNTPFDTIFTAVSSGKVDMAASAINGWAPPGGMIYDVVKQREAIISFTRPIYLVQYLLITSKQKNPDLHSADQMTAGMSIAVVQGGSEETYANQFLAPRGIKVITVKGGAQAFELVDTGRADATLAEAAATAAAAETKTNLQAGEPVEELKAGYAWALPKDDPTFVTKMNDTIGQVIDDGTYATIFSKYFPDAEVPTDLPADSFSAE